MKKYTIMRTNSLCKILTIISIVILLGIQAKSQIAIKVNVPFGKFSGPGLEDTKYRFLFGLLNNINWQLHVPLGDLEKVVVFCEAGIDAIGSKQKIEPAYEGADDLLKTAIYGFNFGLYGKYNFLDPELTPYLFGGCDVHIQLAKDTDPLGTEIDHRLLFSELTIGGGFTFFDGVFSIEFSDDIGLVLVDKDREIKSNVINFSFIAHFR